MSSTDLVPGRAHSVSGWTVSAAARRLIANRWFWCVGLIAIVAARHFAGTSPHPFDARFGGPDDAVRLIQVREFLSSGDWFDTLIPSIGIPGGLPSHWSRLIDAPLALIIMFVGSLSSQGTGELAAQVVWPLALLFVFTRFLVGEAHLRGGAGAVLMLIALIFWSPTALAQFLPGRIDHHNVQIICATVAMFLLARTITDPRYGWAAGAVMALGFVVGIEALPLVAANLAMACLISCFVPAARPGTVRALGMLCVGLIVAYAFTVEPAAWPAVVCDALAPNLIALVGAGAAAGVLLQWRLPRAGAWLWVAGYGVAAAIGTAAYFAANPACTGGAFADIDPFVRKIWLDNVIEAYSLLRLAEIQPAIAVSYLATVALAIAAAVWQARTSRAIADVYIAITVVLAALYGFYFIKFMAYGVWFALVPLAVAFARLPALGDTSARTVRIAAVVLLNQMMLFTLANLAVTALDGDAAAEALKGKASACTYKTDLARLDRLPPGNVVSNLDLGPYIALSGRHRVLAAPYHRIHPAIHRLFETLRAPPAAAETRLREIGASYVVLCTPPGGSAESKLAAEPGQDAATFSRVLHDGGTLPYLEPVDLGPMQGPLKVWKVRPASPK